MSVALCNGRASRRIPAVFLIFFVLRYLARLARNLRRDDVEMNAPIASLANTLLEPLCRPWAIVGSGLAGGALGFDGVRLGARLAWRLLQLLLSL